MEDEAISASDTGRAWIVCRSENPDCIHFATFKDRQTMINNLSEYLTR